MEPSDEDVDVSNQEHLTIDQASKEPGPQSQANDYGIQDHAKQSINQQDVIPTFVIRIILWAMLFFLIDLAVPGLYYLVAEVFNDIYLYITGGLFVLSLIIIIIIEYNRLIKSNLEWKKYKVFLQAFYLSLIISPVETLAVKGYFLNTSSSVVLILLIINTVLFLIVGNYFGRADDRADKQLTVEGVSEKVSINKVQAMHSQLKTFGIAVAIAVILIVIGMLLFGYLLKYVGEHPNQ